VSNSMKKGEIEREEKRNDKRKGSKERQDEREISTSKVRIRLKMNEQFKIFQSSIVRSSSKTITGRLIVFDFKLFE
jgi:hypothetical protein